MARRHRHGTEAQAWHGGTGMAWRHRHGTEAQHAPASPPLAGGSSPGGTARCIAARKSSAPPSLTYLAACPSVWRWILPSAATGKAQDNSAHCALASAYLRLVVDVLAAPESHSGGASHVARSLSVRLGALCQRQQHRLVAQAVHVVLGVGVGALPGRGGGQGEMTGGREGGRRGMG